MPVIRWTINDPVTAVTETFEINPSAGGTPQRRKTFTEESTLAPGGAALLFEGRRPLLTATVSGTILSATQLAQFESWFEKANPLTLTDDLGRVFSIVISAFSPERVYSSSNVYRHSFTLNYFILSTAPAPDPGPGPGPGPPGGSSTLTLDEGVVYVSKSAHASDANDGFSPYTPKATVQAAEAVLSSAGRKGTVYVLPGTYTASRTASASNAGYTAILHVGSGIRIAAVAPGSATLRLTNSASLAGGTLHFMVLNRNLNGGDVDLTFEGIVVDGNGANQSVINHGLGAIRVSRFTCRDVIVKNCRGTSGFPPDESFHFELQLSSHATFINCRVIGDAGQTASGFSANGCTNVSWIGCTASGMSAAHGFTHNGCSNLIYKGCRSHDNAGIGFNSEDSDIVIYDACIAGGRAVVGAIAWPFADGELMGNSSAGWVITNTTNVELAACVSQRNGGDGVFTTGPVTGRIVGGIFGDNGSFGLNLTGTAERGMRISGAPLLTGNALGMLQVATMGIIAVVPGRVLSPPAMGSSNQWRQNTLPFAVGVYIYGGIYTDVYAAAGATETTQPPGGQTSRGPLTYVRLFPGEWVAITYSVIPSWYWEVDTI